ncbi:16973_t:CDS:10 [Entrophospora sp. SA101]|nr:16973_t:CDS:10 [Entrophospora sp. SA101]
MNNDIEIEEFDKTNFVNSILQFIKNSSEGIQNEALNDNDDNDQIDEDTTSKKPLSHEEILQEIEEQYLISKTSFPTSWLCKFQQQSFDCDSSGLLSLAPLEPSKPRINLEILRDGPDGLVTGYKELALSNSGLTSKNSTSLLREPGKLDDFVKGNSNQIPFAPGGFEEVLMDKVDNIVDNFFNVLKFEDDEIQTIIPGFKRGLLFDDDDETKWVPYKKLIGLNITDLITHDDDELSGFGYYSGFEDGDHSKIRDYHDDCIVDDVIDPSSSKDKINEDSQSSKEIIKASKYITNDSKKREWAHVVNLDDELLNFKELIPELAYKYEFELDPFQKQAVYHLESGNSVFVAAHTSAGKTAVAEYAIALAQKHKTHAIYTSPIKALSNQKYRDFKVTFGENNVGILTGDVQINSGASCLIMTTEILRSMLYRGSDLIRDVEFVIFDEVHYVNDSERGVVWEEVIIMLPGHVKFVLLSATVPNTKEFADWIGRTKKKDIYVISTLKRPVPLEHFLYAKKQIYKIVNADRRFLKEGYKLANEALTKKDKEVKTKVSTRGGHGSSSRGGKGKTDKELPQILRMRDLLSRGIAVHHGGLLPVIKEMVEILFSKGLVKVLFATETFAMGVNMPTKTVVFSGIRKHDGKEFRQLIPGEYIQMSGRAGRRSFDKTGTVIIVPSGNEFPSESQLNAMILGTPTKLKSQFRLTYNMILNLLRVESFEVEDMIKRSFSENTSQKTLPDKEREFAEREKILKATKTLECTICNHDIKEFYNISANILDLNRKIITKLADTKALSQGRIIVVNNIAYGNVFAVILNPSFEVLMLLDKSSKAQQLLRHALDMKKTGILENDWSKIRTFEFQLNLKEKVRLMNKIYSFQCIKCPELNEHYGLIHEIMSLEKNLNELLHTITGKNLELMPEYEQRIEVLKYLKYIDEKTSVVQLRGQIACKINTADELLVTELIFGNVLKESEYDPAEIVALLSCLVFQEKNASEPTLTPNLEKGVAEIKKVAKYVGEVQRNKEVDIQVGDYVETIKFGLVEVVYEWARGMPFKDIMGLTDVMEGSIVRCITRLDETCSEIKSAAQLMGNIELCTKMDKARSLIKRDIKIPGSPGTANSVNLFSSETSSAFTISD